MSTWFLLCGRKSIVTISFSRWSIGLRSSFNYKLIFIRYRTKVSIIILITFSFCCWFIFSLSLILWLWIKVYSVIVIIVSTQFLSTSYFSIINLRSWLIESFWIWLMETIWIFYFLIRLFSVSPKASVYKFFTVIKLSYSISKVIIKISLVSPTILPLINTITWFFIHTIMTFVFFL